MQIRMCDHTSKFSLNKSQYTVHGAAADISNRKKWQMNTEKTSSKEQEKHFNL